MNRLIVVLLVGLVLGGCDTNDTQFNSKKENLSLTKALMVFCVCFEDDFNSKMQK